MNWIAIAPTSVVLQCHVPVFVLILMANRHALFPRILYYQVDSRLSTYPDQKHSPSYNHINHQLGRGGMDRLNYSDNTAMSARDIHCLGSGGVVVGLSRLIHLNIKDPQSSQK
jgi:hypothetical protein